jgi:hypothetical protein
MNEPVVIGGKTWDRCASCRTGDHDCITPVRVYYMLGYEKVDTIRLGSDNTYMGECHITLADAVDDLAEQPAYCNYKIYEVREVAVQGPGAGSGAQA